MNGIILPRPIALVSTLSKTGAGNLAPFSSYNLVCSNPPTVLFSITPRRDRSKKDTLRNIEETQEFVINSVAQWMLEKAHQTSAEYPSEVNELNAVGLTTLPSLSVKPPRVAESPVQLECRLTHTVPVGKGELGSAVIVVGEILTFHIREEAYQPDQIVLEALQPVCRLGGDAYAGIGNILHIPRAKL